MTDVDQLSEANFAAVAQYFGRATNNLLKISVHLNTRTQAHKAHASTTIYHRLTIAFCPPPNKYYAKFLSGINFARSAEQPNQTVCRRYFNGFDSLLLFCVRVRVRARAFQLMNKRQQHGL